MKNNVCVLMSTYNGEKYIKQQLESIKNQNNVNVILFIRDDGSSDKTVEIIHEMYPELEIEKGENIGCEASFKELLYSAPEADYYAFSDQDDIWDENKLSDAVKALKDSIETHIYGCNLMACDSKMNPLRKIHNDQEIEIMKNTFRRDILRNMHGCVLVWDRRLQETIKQYKTEYIFPHDVWVNAIGNILGNMAVDKKVNIKYRIHGENVSGLATSPTKRLRKAIRKYIMKGHVERDIIGQELLKGFGDYLDEKSEGYKTLKALSHYKDGITQKIRLCNSHLVKDGRRLDRLFWSLCIFLNRY